MEKKIHDVNVYETEKMMWSQFMDSGFVTYEEYLEIIERLKEQFEVK